MAQPHPRGPHGGPAQRRQERRAREGAPRLRAQLPHPPRPRRERDAGERRRASSTRRRWPSRAARQDSAREAEQLARSSSQVKLTISALSARATSSTARSPARDIEEALADAGLQRRSPPDRDRRDQDASARHHARDPPRHVDHGAGRGSRFRGQVEASGSAASASSRALPTAALLSALSRRALSRVPACCAGVPSSAALSASTHALRDVAPAPPAQQVSACVPHRARPSQTRLASIPAAEGVARARRIVRAHWARRHGALALRAEQGAPPRAIGDDQRRRGGGARGARAPSSPALPRVAGAALHEVRLPEQPEAAGTPASEPGAAPAPAPGTDAARSARGHIRGRALTSTETAHPSRRALAAARASALAAPRTGAIR